MSEKMSVLQALPAWNNQTEAHSLNPTGAGTNDITKLREEDIKINARFIKILKEIGCFSIFYTDKGKVPGSTHVSGHADHVHIN